MSIKNFLVRLLFEKECMSLWGKILFPQNEYFKLLKRIIVATTLLLFILTVLDYNLLPISFGGSLLFSMVTITIALVTGVVNSLMLFSKYYYKHKSFSLYIITALILITTSLFFLVSINREIAINFYPNTFSYITSYRYISLRFITLLITILVTFFYDIIAVLINKVLTSNEQNIQSLSLLRTQLNPHFFFNSLNNIYSFSFVGDQRTPQLILQLSELMRYILYESNTNLISLEKDIDFLRKFCSLQLIKFDHVNFDFRVDIKKGDLKVPPLLILPLVENMFVHGTGGVTYPLIKISIYEEDGFVEVRTENFVGYSKNSDASGVGLENLRRRLDLLFPNNYSLKLHKESAIFYAHLTFKVEQ